MEECSFFVFKFFLYHLFIFKGKGKVVKVEGLVFLEEAAEFEISDSHIALFIVVGQQLHVYI